MQYHPHTARAGYQMSHWVSAAELADGRVFLLGGLATDCTVRLDGHSLVGTSQGGQIAWFTASGDANAVFNGYAKSFLGAIGAPPVSTSNPIRVWCSWYSRYTRISQALLRQDLAGLASTPFDIFQIDDGWQQDIGDWVENSRFPAGLADLARAVHQTGRRAGIWLAPLIATDSSSLFRQNPNWFVRDETGKHVSAGFNWGHPLYALDLTHPQAIQWLANTLARIESLGFSYLKLDFLYAGALPGVRHLNLPGEQAYRQGLRQALSALSPSTFILFCGAPLLPSAGLCHAMRIGPDVAANWQSVRDAELLCNPATPGVRNAIRTSANRLWQAPFYRLDPDVAYFASASHLLSPNQASTLRDLCAATRVLATSDLPHILSPAEKDSLNAFLLNGSEEQAWDPAEPPPFAITGHADTSLDLPARPGLVNRSLRALLAPLAELPATHRALKWVGDLQNTQ